jgi:hypothetical protein
METNRATEPADSPVPGVIPPAPHVETDPDASGHEPDPRSDDEQPSGSARQHGPMRALIDRILSKKR